MLNILKKDSIILGAILGLFFPAIIFAVIYFPSLYISRLNNNNFVTDGYISKIELLSILLPLLLFRYYTINQKSDRTGRGILLVLFIYTSVYFYFTLK
jgi:hypothetical protein